MIPLKKDKEPENKKAVFNMAINTLQRLGDMLEEISKLTHETFLDQMTRQRMKVDLVKQFYVQATPLLPKDKIENYFVSIVRDRGDQGPFQVTAQYIQSMLDQAEMSLKQATQATGEAKTRFALMAKEQYDFAKAAATASLYAVPP